MRSGVHEPGAGDAHGTMPHYASRLNAASGVIATAGLAANYTAAAVLIATVGRCVWPAEWSRAVDALTVCLFCSAFGLGVLYNATAYYVRSSGLAAKAIASCDPTALAGVMRLVHYGGRHCPIDLASVARLLDALTTDDLRRLPLATAADIRYVAMYGELRAAGGTAAFVVAAIRLWRRAPWLANRGTLNYIARFGGTYDGRLAASRCAHDLFGGKGSTS